MDDAAAFDYLEDGTDPRTLAWQREQNRRARTFLDGVPGRAALAERLGRLLDTGTLSVPVGAADAEFFTARKGGRQQAALFVRRGGEERTLYDPAEHDPEGLTAIDWWYPSPRGTYVALGLSRNGDERSVLHLLDVATGAFAADQIADTRLASVAWLPDERAFYYTRYPPGGDYEQRVYLHAIGDDPARDPLVFGEGRAKEDCFTLHLSASGRWLAIAALRGWSASDVYLCDLQGVDPYFVTVVAGRESLNDPLPTDDALYVHTNDGAPNFRLCVADPYEPGIAAWREVVPEDAHAKLESVALTSRALLLVYLRNVLSELWTAERDGGSPRKVEHPSLGPTIAALSARDDAPVAYVLSSGFFSPPGVVRVRTGDGAARIEPWGALEAPFDPSPYRWRQDWYASADGTRVPLFVLSRGEPRRDGRAPAVLYGYGGFNISLGPAFAPALIPWLDAGGIYAIANLRGGGEFGEAWHRAGMRERKQNVFDDFFAAAEFLAREKLADPARIAAFGGSNGGLLTAAAAVQRPGLFRAVISAVPLCDMLRYTRFSIARLWIKEYGDPDDPADAGFLRAYSPFHNVRAGVAYPAVFAVSAESDSRVDPSHARKFAAKLQAATASEHPILCFVESAAGHGAGKPRDKQVEELADRWSFLASQLGVDLAARAEASP